MKFRLADWANLAEIVGAVAIVVSLIYVGQELRSNTAAVQAASQQSITNASSVSMLSIAENADLAEIRAIGDVDPGQLAPVDRLRYVLYQRQMLLHFQNVWTQWRLGVIEDQVWDGYANVICGDLAGDARSKAWWREQHRYALSEGFAALIESCE